MSAKYEKKCWVCGETVKVGEKIYYNADKKTIRHEKCENLKSEKNEVVPDVYGEKIDEIFPQCISAEELKTWAINTIVPQVSGHITDIKERKTGNGKTITEYYFDDIIIFVWGGNDTKVAIGDQVLFNSVAISTFGNKKQYTARKIEKNNEEEIPF